MMFFRKMSSYSKNAYIYLTLLGFAFIIFGILLLIMPELLAYLISFLFILIGVASITMGWKIHQTEKNIRQRVENVSDTINKTIHGISDRFGMF